MESMGVLEEWEASLPSKNTRDHHSRALRYFADYMKEDPETLLKLRREQYGKSKLFETKVIQFYKWLQDTKGMTGNSARSYCIGIQSYFSYYDLPLKLKNRLPNLHMRLDEKKLTVEDLRKLFKYNDLTIKTWIALSRDCPARISDLIALKRSQIAPEFKILTTKENTIGKVFLSEETLDLFQRFWKTVPESEYAFSTPTGEQYDQSGINKMLKRASKKADLEDLKLHQHSFRKLWITCAINLGLPEIVWKILTFKAVPSDMLTYFMDREDLHGYWKKIIDFLSLEPQANGRVGNLEQMVDLMLRAWKKTILEEIKKEPIAFKLTGNAITADEVFKDMSPEELLTLFVKKKD